MLYRLRMFRVWSSCLLFITMCYFVLLFQMIILFLCVSLSMFVRTVYLSIYILVLCFYLYWPKVPLRYYTGDFTRVNYTIVV